MAPTPHRRRWQPLAMLGLLFALTSCSLSAGPPPTSTASLDAPAAPPTSTPAASTPVTTVLPSATPSTPTTAPNTLQSRTPPSRAKLTQRVVELIAAQPAQSVSVAALNVKTGARFSAGESSGIWTGSLYKLLATQALLLEHQQSGTPLSADEQEQASEALKHSDNEAGYQLYLNAGGQTGLDRAAAAFGMTHTGGGDYDPAFTTTSGTDCLALLSNVVSSASPLAAPARAYLLTLMQNVQADQQWGVGAAADPDTSLANKNGWLSVRPSDDNGDGTIDGGPDDGGRWVATSAGIITVHGQQVLLAVLTQHQQSLADGITLVEQLAKLAAQVVAP